MALNLARSSFYAAGKAKIKNDSLDFKIWNRIRKVWNGFPGWGYRKLADELNQNEKKIRRILNKFRDQNKKARKGKAGKKPFCKYPNLIKLITNDLVKNPQKLKRGNWILRDGKNKYRKVIDPVRPYQLWAGDRKEFHLPLLGVTIYIFIIIDCYTRQLVGFEISLIKDGYTSLKASKKTLKKALADPLFDPRRLIMHTDQGSAYLSFVYEEFWKMHGVKLSAADKGKPTQNPYAEAFFSLLSRFCLKQYELLTVSDVRQTVTKFINLYNCRWRHGQMKNMTPNQKLEQYRSYLTN